MYTTTLVYTVHGKVQQIALHSYTAHGRLTTHTYSSLSWYMHCYTVI